MSAWHLRADPTNIGTGPWTSLARSRDFAKDAGQHFRGAAMPILALSHSQRLVAKRLSSRFHRLHSPQLDRIPPSPHLRSKVPWGVVGTIGLIVVIECLIGRNWLDFSDPVSLSWRFSTEAARTEAAGSQLLCLGDSLVKHGLIPSVIEGESGLRTLNLSAARAPTLMTFFLFRRALDAGARPDVIIINAKPAVLIGGPDFNARYFQEVLTFRECVELFQITKRSSFMISMLVGRLLPSLRCRLEVRSNLLATLRGETDRLHDINRTLWRNWTVNGGANIADLDSRYEKKVTRDVARRMQTDLFYVDRMNALAIERLLELAAKRNIPVFWLLTPLAPGLQAFRDQSGSEAGYERFVRSAQWRYPQTLTVLDARRGAYPPWFFVDSTHLNGRGGIALSRAVATALEAELGQSERAAVPRWITLQLSIDHPEVVGRGLEDVQHSKKIVGLETNHGLLFTTEGTENMEKHNLGH
jgi:hypothetical protein